MIKKNWVLLFLMVLSLSVSAQTKQDTVLYNDIPQFKFGVRAGMNFAQISGSGAQGFNHFGALAGAIFEYRIKNRMAIATELLYSMKGARRNPNPDFGDFNSYSFDLDYIEIPALFRYYLGKREFVSLDAGLTLGFLVRQMGKENGAVIKFDRGFNVFELGVAASINFHLPKGWGVTARYTNSIIPIRANINNNVVVQPIWGLVNIGQVNSAFNISLTYSFGIGKKTVQVIAPSLQMKPKTVKVQTSTENPSTTESETTEEEKPAKPPMFQKIEMEKKAPKPKKQKRPRGDVYDEDE